MMDVKFINPYVRATLTVLKTMLEIDASIGTPTLKVAKTTSEEITSVMSVAGDKEGTITMSFGEKGALLVFNRLMRDEATSLCPEVADAIGELTNIVARRARREFENSGINLETSPPMVAVCKELQTNSVTKLPIISVPFNFPVNNDNQELIHLEFAFK